MGVSKSKKIKKRRVWYAGRWGGDLSKQVVKFSAGFHIYFGYGKLIGKVANRYHMTTGHCNHSK